MTTAASRVFATLLGLAGVALCYTVSSSLRRQVVDTVTDLRGGQPWDKAAHKRILATILTSQLKGADERSYWISFVEGISFLPISTPGQRKESFRRAADDLPSKSETWLATSTELDFWYLRFLGDLGSEAERRKEFDQSELMAWREMQQILRERGLPSSTIETNKWRRAVESALTFLQRPPKLGETSRALNEALKFQQFPGGLREAFFTEPSHDVETDFGTLGKTIYSYAVGSYRGQIGAIHAFQQNQVEGTIEVANDVRQFIVKRPWMDESLLDKYAPRKTVNGELFFGEHGPLHLIPTHIIVRSEPRYIVLLGATATETIRQLVKSGQCCEISFGSEHRYMDASSALLNGSTLVGTDSILKPEIFAVISKIR